jgi:hypothetical protein
MNLLEEEEYKQSMSPRASIVGSSPDTKRMSLHVIIEDSENEDQKEAI